VSIRFSLIIPAYNEEDYLSTLLDTVDAARAAYHGGAEAIEVIVADNASTDRTAAIAEARGCRVARVEKRVIGAARNGGARLARGEILCFVDADMRIHPQTFNEIDRALTNRRVAAGTTGALPDRWSPGITITVALLAPLAALLRIDTGVVFCRRADFENIGGYREDRLFAEDVALLAALWKRALPSGQYLTRIPRARAVASTRKFDKHGDWHFFRLPWHVFIGLWREPATQRWARRYWYEDR
jgi:glycosyltransferase involved in cell wall biosynthesis